MYDSFFFLRKNSFNSLTIFVGTYLGQNFLTDNKIRHRIADKIQQQYDMLQAECLIEI